MTRRRSCVLLALALAMFPAPALAQDMESRWYGWQTMFVDLGAVGLMFAGAESDGEAIAWVGVGVFVAGSTVVHVAHGNVGGALVAPLLRAGLPLGAALVAGGACDDDGDLACLGPAVGGLLAGAALAVVLDYSLLAHEPRRLPPVGVAVLPRDGGLSVGLMGWF